MLLFRSAFLFFSLAASSAVGPGAADLTLPDGPINYFAGAHDGYVEVGAESQLVPRSPDAGPGAVTTHLQRMRAPICPLGANSQGAQIPCPGDPVVPLPECGDAATLPPLWERAVPDAVVTPWRLVGPPVCASSADITPAMVLSAFRRLPLAPSPLVVQPDRGWVLVNKPTVVYADGGPQTLTTTVLGTAVTIAATPTGYVWDFGDGATLATADPGLPWPAGTLTHSYTAVGVHHLSLTTTWSATYTVAGDPAVRDVPGTATTTSTSQLEVRERRAYLVGATCDDDPAAPGC
jgi:hypothetical protein